MPAPAPIPAPPQPDQTTQPARAARASQHPPVLIEVVRASAELFRHFFIQAAGMAAFCRLRGIQGVIHMSNLTFDHRGAHRTLRYDLCRDIQVEEHHEMVYNPRNGFHVHISTLLNCDGEAISNWHCTSFRVIPTAPETAMVRVYADLDPDTMEVQVAPIFRRLVHVWILGADNA